MLRLVPARCPAPNPVVSWNGTLMDCASGFLCSLASSCRLGRSFVGAEGSCATAGVAKTDQASTPTTILVTVTFRHTFLACCAPAATLGRERSGGSLPRSDQKRQVRQRLGRVHQHDRLTAQLQLATPAAQAGPRSTEPPLH